MRTIERVSSSANELQFELKYCERCGGLWLRPAGGGQVYCVACGRAMAELPPPPTPGTAWKAHGCSKDRDGAWMTAKLKTMRKTNTRDWILMQPEVWHERLRRSDWGTGG
jgi:hypothetical protein